MNRDTPDNSPIQIGILDDHPFVSDCLKSLFAEDARIQISWYACNLDDAKKLIDQAPPNILLLDIQINNDTKGGLEIARHARILQPDLNVFIFSAHVSMRLVAEAANYGAIGYFSKSDPLEYLKEGIYNVLETKNPSFQGPYASWRNRILKEISPRELEVLKRLSRGESNKEIAAALSISVATVKSHLESIFSKLGVSNRTDAMRVALKENCLFLSDL